LGSAFKSATLNIRTFTGSTCPFITGITFTTYDYVLSVLRGQLTGLHPLHHLEAVDREIARAHTGTTLEFLPVTEPVLRSWSIFVRLRFQLVKNFGSGSSSDHFPHIGILEKNQKLSWLYKIFMFLKDINTGNHQKVLLGTGNFYYKS
jgi:hypothetical protein